MKTTVPPPSLQVLSSPAWKDYVLLDSGNGRRLEKFGEVIVIRPDAEAIWTPALPDKDWQAAAAQFVPGQEENGGHWEWKGPEVTRWPLEYRGMRFWLQPGGSKQLGVFPEQAVQWDWIEAQVKAASRPVQVLNMFGYTGLASLAAARAGAAVAHVDASRKVIGWARENQALSGLESAPVRWLLDDALKFVRREGRRGSGYDGLILDPPKFGRGPKGEVWEFYKLLPELLDACAQALSAQPRFVLLTAYAVKASSITLYYAVEEMMRRFGGHTEAGEVVLVEKSAGRQLSTAIFARWSAS
ncbi:MAG: class I SAM-dependent methyltransferase [Anaerolineae bacterium]|nr:class I SAM-dependent methyltransferase [Anaerolineae bacterium]